MSALVSIARVALWLTIAAGIYAVLPDADPDTCFGRSMLSTCVVILPDPIWNGLVAVVGLDKYVPIAALVTLTTLTQGIRAGLATAWLIGWVWEKVKPT